MRIRDELGIVYDDEDCATLFATRGQPAESLASSPGEAFSCVAIPGVFLIMVHEPPNAWETRRWSLRLRMIEGNGTP